MKFEILNRQFKDKNIENLIIKMFEYFAVENCERAEKIKKTKNKEEILKMLKELADYVESGLKKKFSENFIVLISEHPNYAMKYERHYLLGNTKSIEKLSKFSDSDLTNTIIKNISYYKLTSATEKDLSKLALGIQYDISQVDKDYK